MAKDYYVKDADSVLGPLAVEQIRQMASAGRITPDSLIATSADGPWHAASSARGIDFAKVAPVAEVLPPAPPPLPIVVQPVVDTAPSLNRPAKLTGKQWKAMILIGSVLLICAIIFGIYSLVTNSNSDSRGNADAVSGDPSLEACVACGKSVSVNAKVCPHCGEPNPSPSIREEIAKAKARGDAEKRKQAKAASDLSDAELLGPELLTEEGRNVLLLPEDFRLRAMRSLVDEGKDPITELGRKALTEYNAAVDKVYKGKHANEDEEFKLLEQAEANLRKEVREAAEEQKLTRMPAVFERLRTEVERLAKEKGTLPDEDTIEKIAFPDAMRDPWFLPLKYKIIDAKAGKYVLTGAGLDFTYDTADDPKLECQLGKP